jgi:hypothetical protein
VGRIGRNANEEVIAVARLIGLDEAGLGPNFGPFVVAATVWDVPGSALKFDFWKSFAKVVTNEPQSDDDRLFIADSKKVFDPQRGIEMLERGVLSALRMIDHIPTCFDSLHKILCADPDYAPCADSTPWYLHTTLELPAETGCDGVRSDRWKKCCESIGAKLISIRATVVEPREFNRYLREYDNKALVVSRVAFRLLRSLWNPDDGETLVVADKHGGRNRYDVLLSEILDGDMIFRCVEGLELSEYRVGKTTLRFQPRAEVHGPVALASMTAKYVRELAMMRFNRFWANHIDGLKPTQGYPLDAVRFRRDIAEIQQRLGIEDDILWRNR